MEDTLPLNPFGMNLFKFGKTKSTIFLSLSLVQNRHPTIKNSTNEIEMAHRVHSSSFRIVIVVILLILFFLSPIGPVASSHAQQQQQQQQPVKKPRKEYRELVDLMLDIATKMCSKLGPLVAVASGDADETQRQAAESSVIGVAAPSADPKLLSVPSSSDAVGGSGTKGRKNNNNNKKKKEAFNWRGRCDLVYDAIERICAKHGDAMVQELDLTQQDLVTSALYPQNYYTLVTSLKSVVTQVLTVAPDNKRLSDTSEMEPSSSSNSNSKWKKTGGKSSGDADKKKGEAPPLTREQREEVQRRTRFSEADLDLFLHQMLSSFILRAATQDRGHAQYMRDIPREAHKNALGAGFRLPTYGVGDVDEMDIESFLTEEDLNTVQLKRTQKMEMEELETRGRRSRSPPPSSARASSADEVDADSDAAAALAAAADAMFTEDDDEKIIDELSRETWI